MPYSPAQWRAIAASYFRKYPEKIAHQKLSQLKRHMKGGSK